jgi:hypothetical protein
MAENEVIEARVLDALDEAETVRLPADLVRVPSVTGTDAESDLQHRCARPARPAPLRDEELNGGVRVPAI